MIEKQSILKLYKVNINSEVGTVVFDFTINAKQNLKEAIEIFTSLVEANFSMELYLDIEEVKSMINRIERQKGFLVKEHNKIITFIFHYKESIFNFGIY